MAGWLRFAGQLSTDLGVIVQEHPPLTLPEERAEFQKVLGRSGTLTLLEGDAVYEDLVLSADCYVRDLDKIDKIAAWLRGDGDLIFGNMPTRYYKARCVNQTEFKKILRGHAHRTFTAVFRCKPYRYVFPEPSAKTITASPGSINNPGTADAEPVITVTGSGDIELTIGDKVVEIEGLESAVTIYTETGRAYNGDTELTSTIGRDAFPLALPPGLSAVSWTGSVTSVAITRPWRYV